ncbi:elongation factor P [Buchnera aphidicola]|uniref:elongation factor P n=1 Tax=Buchnera aphidicola TaxID=9 RepID=UPI0022388261|nr:elongation factor P [Buchnera aphidicola]MCW5197404.1 elongation factor P [Buchnera aphidicola (Chaitophorus viminalis)]
MTQDYSINKFKPGLKVIIFNQPCIIQNSKFVKPGKGQAFSRVKFKSLISGKIVESTFKSTDRLKKANVYDIKSIYLYNDNKFWYFINSKTFEEISVKKKILNTKRFFLTPQCKCLLTIWKNSIISIILDNFVYLKVIKTTPSVQKKSLNSSGIKLATLNTGISIKVPEFIKINDVIKIDTRTCLYISRL